MDLNFDKKKKKRSKVAPSDLQSTFVDNHGFEKDFTDDEKTDNFNRKSFKKVLEAVQPARNAIAAISNAKASGSQWRKYVTSRRKVQEDTKLWNASISGSEDCRRKNRGLGLDEVHDKFMLNNSVSVVDGLKFSSARLAAENNRALIQYFANQGQQKTCDGNNINLEFIYSLLSAGAQVNCTDKHGQTVLHEVARVWHSDVAKFLIEQGADVNQADKMGRTPLHIAAYLDYPDMVNLLISCGADKEACTMGEKQTPVFYAAKNDACQSLKALIRSDCEFKLIRDFKGRTPLHLAAELDRSETARFLLDLGAPVGVSDSTGQKTITHMITKMPPVAVDALDQFHKKFRAERKQYFYLNFLVQENIEGSQAPSPMQMAVTHRQHDILTHKVLLKLLNCQWKSFGLLRALRDVVLNLIFIILWTVIGCEIKFDDKHIYKFPEHWWRIVLFIFATAITVYQIFVEILEYRKSKKNHNLWKAWRLKQIEKDLEYAHPRWPEEENFLRKEIDTLDKSLPKYWQDWWNVFDWTCFLLLVISMSIHIADVAHHTNTLARTHIRFMAITIILLWLRLMKNARAFEALGPFIVILTHMFGDVLRFAFLYLEFYIPYVCAFLMLFGGTNPPENPDTNNAANNVIIVNRFQYVNEVFFTLFRLTLVDEYDYDNMKLVDSLMADFLLGTWFALSAILCLNLFIALLSDTFQRVYDNAQANAVMQKAITVLSIWDSLSKERQRAFIKTCREALVDEYDDDITGSGDEDLKKVTFQIKDHLEQLEEKWDRNQANRDVSGGKGTSGLMRRDSGADNSVKNQISNLRVGLNNLHNAQENLAQKFEQEMNVIKSLLIQIVGQSGGGTLSSVPAPGVFVDSGAQSYSAVSGTVGDRAVLPLIQSVHSSGDAPVRLRRKEKKKKSKSQLEDPSKGYHYQQLSETTQGAPLPSDSLPLSAVEVTSVSPVSSQPKQRPGLRTDLDESTEDVTPLDHTSEC